MDFSHKWRSVSITIIIMTLFLFAMALPIIAEQSVNSVNYDNLIEKGNACLEDTAYQCAKDAFVLAYIRGMSRDSLCFLIAALYLKKQVFDTALVYNLAVHFLDSTLMSKVHTQRLLILNGIRPSDTLPKLTGYRQKYLSDFGLSASLFYTDSKSDNFLIPWNNSTSTILEYRMPGSGLAFNYSLAKDRKNKLIHAGLFSIGTTIPLIEPFKNDAFTENIYASAGFKLLNTANNSVFFNKLTFTHDFKSNKIFSDDFSFCFPLAKKKMQYIPGITGSVSFFKSIDSSEGNFSLYLIGLNEKRKLFSGRCYLDLSYNWNPTETWLKIVKGYTDSLIEGGRYRYFFDPLCTLPYTENSVSRYWDQLPSEDWVYSPGRFLSTQLTFDGSLKAGKSIRIKSGIGVKGKLDLIKTGWFNISGDNLTFYPRNGELVMVLIYDKNSQQLKYHNEPLSRTYNGGLLPVSYSEIRRIDITFSFKICLEYTKSRLGAFILSAWVNKTRSNLNGRNFPVPLPGVNFGLHGEWDVTLWRLQSNDKNSVN